MNPTLTLMVVALVVASSGMPTDINPGQYYPCEMEEAEEGESGTGIECPFFNMPELIRQAFERNAPNKGVSSVHMHSDIEGTVMDFIADHDLLSGSYDTITEFLLAYTPSTNFPKLVSKLSALEHLHLDHTAIGPVKAGSLSLPSPKTLKLMTISYSPLYDFEAGAFPEGFHADVILKNNNMTRINGAAFKPILQSGSKLSFTTNSIKCDCDLSWLVRDGRELLPSVDGRCLKANGDFVSLQDADPKDFSNCP